MTRNTPLLCRSKVLCRPELNTLSSAPAAMDLPLLSTLIAHPR